MPGLFGILSKNARFPQTELRTMALRMADTLRSQPWLRAEIWDNRGFCGGRVHLGILNQNPQPLKSEKTGHYIWFDGEIYPSSGERGITPTGADVEAWVNAPGRLLAKIDGIFSFTCYNNETNELIIGTDRFGFRPLYFTETKEWFAYAAEVKALLAIRDKLPELDEIALRQFFCFDHMLGERTWWKGIELIPAASLWRIQSDARSTKQYWNFADIRTDIRPVNEVLQEFNRLWKRAVRQRLQPGPMPLLLSGGLDSRLLLAELKRQGADVFAITFGSTDCPDIKIARDCARLADVPHHIRHMTAENWWQGREDAIWQTDGLASAIHLHEAIVRDDMHSGTWVSQKSNIGDAILHGKHIDGSRIEDWANHPEKLLSRRMWRSPFFDGEEVLAHSTEDARRYLVGSTLDGFFLLQNTRRLNLSGNLTLAPYCEILLPRASFPLLHLIISSVSEDERCDSRFYIRFLIDNYPEYFVNFPWQKTGRGLSESLPLRLVRDLRDEGKRKAHKLSKRIPGVWRIARRLKPAYQYFVDYYQLLKATGIRDKLLRETLLSDEFLQGRARTVLKDPPGEPNAQAQTLMALLTFETYLRQVAGVPGLTVSDGLEIKQVSSPGSRSPVVLQTARNC